RLRGGVTSTVPTPASADEPCVSLFDRTLARVVRILSLTTRKLQKMKLRCKNQSCNKLLAIGYGNIQIKCPRCKQISQFKVA
ncbi:hypothetical protein, partial [Kingella kingae]|uniref:hypothetical protein n=1 Tax=Kingella kingae TaxID=504 RepID=UPI00254AD3F4